MTDREKKTLLHCGLFAGLTEAESERLLGCLNIEEQHYEKNQMVWHMGDRITACAVVLSGLVQAESVSSAGSHSLTAQHGPGALVGDILMATPGGVSPVYIRAAEGATLAFVPFHGIMGGCERCCAAHVRLRENLISEIAQKFWAQRQRIRYLEEGSLRKKLTMYLLDRAGNGEQVQIGLTREDLADYLGVNRSALCRELGRMKAEGLVEFDRRIFRIRPKLREYGE